VGTAGLLRSTARRPVAPAGGTKHLPAAVGQSVNLYHARPTLHLSRAARREQSPCSEREHWRASWCAPMQGQQRRGADSSRCEDAARMLRGAKLPNITLDVFPRQPVYLLELLGGRACTGGIRGDLPRAGLGVSRPHRPFPCTVRLPNHGNATAAVARLHYIHWCRTACTTHRVRHGLAPGGHRIVGLPLDFRPPPHARPVRQSQVVCAHGHLGTRRCVAARAPSHLLSSV
jgi:hypothetical protein